MRIFHSDVKLSLTNTSSAALINAPTPLTSALRRHRFSLPHLQSSMDNLSVHPLYRTHTQLAKITKYAPEPDHVAIAASASRAPQQDLCIRLRKYSERLLHQDHKRSYAPLPNTPPPHLPPSLCRSHKSHAIIQGGTFRYTNSTGRLCEPSRLGEVR